MHLNQITLNYQITALVLMKAKQFKEKLVIFWKKLLVSAKIMHANGW